MTAVLKGAKGRPMADPSTPMSDKFEKQRQEESKLIKGVFQDNEVKGGNVRFFFRKWKGDDIKEYHLFDGEVYELPLSVVKHLNSNCCYEQHSYLMDPKGQHIKTGKKVHRFSFKSSEYC